MPKTRKRPAALGEGENDKKAEKADSASEDLEELAASSSASSSKARKRQPKKMKKPEADSPIELSSDDEEVTEKKGKAKKAKKPEPGEKAPKLPMRSVIQLKITLRDVNPPIWRRIQVLNNITFEELRRNINEAMGWMSDRSHQFIIYDPKKNSNILIVNGTLAGVTYDFDKEKGRLFKEQDTKLCKYFNAIGESILYEFDLGDSWMHEVVLEKVFAPAVKKADYPRIVGGKRACPPEDCGGVDGYHHLLEVYQNPQHAEYEELIENWLQEDYPGYNPEVFNKKKVFKKPTKPKKVWMWLPQRPRGGAPLF